MLNRLSPAIKKLLLINIALFAIKTLLEFSGIDLNPLLALYFIKSENFLPLQFVTYGFMHADIIHIFFNMFMVTMFGVVLEKVWGSQKFLFFYFTCILSAAALHVGINYYSYLKIADQISPSDFQEVINYGYNALNLGKNFTNPILAELNLILNTPMIGASGAVFGIMIAFATLFPNTELYLMFIPIPIKAKYAMGLMAVAELFLGVANFSGDNIAHFAHLGGAIAGFILVKVWQKDRTNFY